MQPEVFFLPVASTQTEDVGQRLCMYYPAQHDGVACTPQGLVLYIHPFGEEMNKSRHMAALQSRALAQAGFSVLQIDLLGCGDSSGDFGDATWLSWVGDAVAGCLWLRQRCTPANDSPELPLWIWGLRAGSLLAVDAAKQLDKPCNLLFWQAPGAGKTLLQQFLRLKVAGNMLGGQSKGVMETMRQQLANGQPVEIAGYMLSPGLAAGLEQAALTPPERGSAAQRLVWFDLSTRDEATLSPIATQSIEQWQQAGYTVDSQVVQGPAFWQTAEIEEAPALIAATVAALVAQTAAMHTT